MRMRILNGGVTIWKYRMVRFLGKNKNNFKKVSHKFAYVRIQYLRHALIDKESSEATAAKRCK